MMRRLISLVENARLAPFASMTRGQFLGEPRITKNTNASDLRPRILRTLVDAPREPFLGRYECACNEDGIVVFDGDKPIASYNFGDTLVVDPKYRRQGIGQEMVYQWRTHNPGATPAKHRTRASQALQMKVWDRIQRELDGK